MKRIATFELLGREWEEVLDQEGCEAMEAHGYCNWSKSRIGLSVVDNDDLGQEVRYHEWAHAISDSLGLNLTHEQIHGLGAGLHQIAKSYRPVGPVKKTQSKGHKRSKK